MNQHRLAVCLTVLCTGLSLYAQSPSGVSDAWTLETVNAHARLVADWMTAHPRRHSQLDWTYGAFFTGIAALGLSDPTLPYLDQIRDLGRKNRWKPLTRTYHADDHCIGQSWLELAAFDNNPTYAAGLKLTYDYILAFPHTGPLDFTKKDNQKRWSWCDALFMSPTVLVRMHGLTGDARYLDFMDKEYKATTDYLYSKEDHFFFRDSRYFEQMTKAGKHKYWSRGNGWVFGSLPLILRDLPADRASRAFYQDLFKQMAAALKKAQRPDGAWSPNLGDLAEPDMQEMSGTAFFTYGMLWGINNGLLDRAEYLPCAQRAWQALCRNINAEGRLGWVQQIGDRPVSDFTAESTEVYAVGAYLLAAMELRKMIVADAHPARKTVGIVNPLALYRGAETVTLDWGRLGMQAAKVRVFDVRNGAVLPHQLFDSDGDGTPDQLLFKTYALAHQSRTFWIMESDTLPAAPTEAVCFSRHVPERMDDAAWENDRMAFRLYGPKVSEPAPAGEGLISSGIDVWCKKTRRPVINSWYASGKYHDDHGEGLDYYKVGPGRGCGGLGLFNGGACYVSGNWVTHKTLATGPVRTVFELTYAPWACGEGVSVRETRRVSIDAGSHFTRIESRLSVTGKAALQAGPGLDISAGRQHNGLLAARPDQGWVANYEPAHPKHGSIATAIVVPEKATLATDSIDNLYLLRALAADKPLVWYAGAAWSGAGDFVNADAWTAHVSAFAASLRTPLTVTLK